MAIATDRKLLTCNEVIEELQVSRATLYDLMRRRGFPIPIRLANGLTKGRPANRWHAHEVAAWLESRERAPIHIETSA